VIGRQRSLTGRVGILDLSMESEIFPKRVEGGVPLHVRLSRLLRECYKQSFVMRCCVYVDPVDMQCEGRREWQERCHSGYLLREYPPVVGLWVRVLAVILRTLALVIVRVLCVRYRDE
jgi:hypothetical protein